MKFFATLLYAAVLTLVAAHSAQADDCSVAVVKIRQLRAQAAQSTQEEAIARAGYLPPPQVIYTPYGPVMQQQAPIQSRAGIIAQAIHGGLANSYARQADQLELAAAQAGCL
jgi:hypothetical protein